MKIFSLILFVGCVAVARANDNWYRDYQLSRQADALEMQNFITELNSQPVVINAAGEGCHWMRILDENNDPQSVIMANGKLGSMYVKECTGDKVEDDIPPSERDKFEIITVRNAKELLAKKDEDINQLKAHIIKMEKEAKNRNLASVGENGHQMLQGMAMIPITDDYIKVIQARKEKNDTVYIDFSALPNGVDGAKIADELSSGLSDEYAKVIHSRYANKSKMILDYSKAEKKTALAEFTQWLRQ
jgi:hypothetical protein